MDPQRDDSQRLDTTEVSPCSRYWGKAMPDSTSAVRYHPLPFHSLDVAAVGHVYLAANPHLLEYFSRILGVSRDCARGWVCFCLALHDLGKFSLAFQNQRPDLLLKLQSRTSIRPYSVRHDSLGALVWQKRLLIAEDVMSLGPRASTYSLRMQPWIFAVTGHHGQPPRLDGVNVVGHFESLDVAAAAAFAREARTLLLPQDTLDALLAMGDRLREAGRRLSWWLAGVAVLADWVGSNTDYFPYCTSSLPLVEYWSTAKSQAVTAMRASGVLPQSIGPARTLATLFSWPSGPEQRTPTPLQLWAEQVPLPQSPQLYLLEDVTGAGKTEAALMLAHRLMVAGHADGIYFGLPTMATSNAMFTRVSGMASQLFDSEASPSVVLAHSQRRLVAGFRDSVVLPGCTSEDDPRQSCDETASARCTAWLADSNKKALLAQVGVGTLDQAQMAVLHAKHQSLRLLGLFRKVLIVDEVHACDVYMQTVLERLLQFHATAGGSAILLSATLPQRTKQSLVKAFAHGAVRPVSQLSAMEYPLATQIADGISVEQPLDTRPDVRREVEVECVSDLNDVHARVADAIDGGRCVCWIRNTVADAIAAWQYFCDAVGGERVTLFHARFSMGDRLHIEDKVRIGFGESSGPADRSGRLVIATQVVEQSLDVDFDLLVSDLAPIDRIIQRAGRMQRHQRDHDGQRIHGPDQRGGARLIVFGPALTVAPAEDWYRRVFPSGAFVYPHVGHLWLTARCLQTGRFAMPDDARALIEGVYGEDAQADIPKGLVAASLTVDGKDWAAANIADNNRLDITTGYMRGNLGDWSSDAESPQAMGQDDWSGDAGATRLGEPTTCVRLARWQDGALTPWHGDGWDASSLRLPSRLIVESVVDLHQREAFDRCNVSLPDRGRWSVLLALKMVSDGAWRARAKDSRGHERHWCYGRMGLVQTDESHSKPHSNGER